MKELTNEQKKKVIDGIKKVKPELSEEDIKKMNNIELKKVKGEDLEKINGGGLFDFLEYGEINPNQEINGWTYNDLHYILCWTYETCISLNDSEDMAKNRTIAFAEELFPSSFWAKFAYLNYPEFINQPMWKIWRGGKY